MTPRNLVIAQYIHSIDIELVLDTWNASLIGMGAEIWG